MKYLAPLLLAVLVPLAGTAELPNEALVCPAETDELDAHRYLRALALDVTGTPPTLSQYETLEASNGDVDALLDEMLWSDAFAERVVRRHMDLLWPNVSNVRLVNTRAALTRTNNIYWIRARSGAYRGDDVRCLDEPVSYLADGSIATTTTVDESDGDVSEREGWVDVPAYWLGDGATIRVCAFDAQDALVSVAGTDCSLREGLTDVGCGCGPEMRWCRYGSTETMVTEAMAADLKGRVRAMILDDEPYVTLFTSPRAFVTGPLVFHLRNLLNRFANIRLFPLPVSLDELPDIEFTDDSVHEITLGAEHAGVLTSWAFLLRFQTNRARANRFYNAFLCEPFQPPAGGIPFADEAAIHQPDLQKRAGCKYCHSLLEPSSSFWGRWPENGAGYLEPAEFPPLREDCLACAQTGQNCSPDCNLYYLTKPVASEQTPYLGKLSAYEFRRPEHEQNVEVGPRVLALSAVVDHRVPTCAARRTAEWLLNRELQPDEGPWLESLANEFVADGYRYRSLVKAILTSPVYRRVR